MSLVNARPISAKGNHFLQVKPASFFILSCKLVKQVLTCKIGRGKLGYFTYFPVVLQTPVALLFYLFYRI